MKRIANAMSPTLVCHLVLITCLAVAKRIPGASKPVSIGRNYNITFSTLYFSELNPDYFGPTTIAKLHGPNVFSFRLEILQTFPPDAKTVVNTFEKNSRNEYVPSLTARDTVCDEYKREKENLPIYKCLRNIEAGITECPFPKGIYVASHVRCTSSDFPALVPGHHWRVNRTLMTGKNVILSQTIVDFTIERKSLVPFV